MLALITATLSPEFITDNFYCYFQYAGALLAALVLLAIGCWLRRR